MPVQGSRLVIQLSPTRLEVGVRRGRSIIACRRIPLDPGKWEEAWEHRLRTLDDVLADAVRSLDTRVSRVVVYHHGPSATAEVFSCQPRGAAAIEAGLLALGDHVTYPLDDNPHHGEILAVDRSGQAKHSHVLLTADSNNSAEIMTDWIERAELTPQAVIPMDAALLASAVRRTMACSGDFLHVQLRLGEHSAFLTAGGGGILRIARRIDIDLHMLTEALSRPMALGQDGGSLPILSRDQALRLLFDHGIPGRNDVLEPESGLRGADVLPSIQPILQRCIVEMRQSLRFGLSDTERETARLIITGPGASLSQFGEILAAETGLTLDPSDGDGPFDPDTPGAQFGDLHTAATCRDIESNLLPVALAQQARVGRLQRALWVGAGLAALTAIGDASLSLSSASAARAELASLEPSLEQIRQLQEHREQTHTRQEGSRLTQRAIAKAMGNNPIWIAWFKELGALTPQQVRLVEIISSQSATGFETTLKGWVLSDPAEVSVDQGSADGVSTANSPVTKHFDITDFAKRLEASPLVESVGLGATHRTFAGNQQALQFTMTVRLVQLPSVFATADGDAQ